MAERETPSYTMVFPHWGVFVKHRGQSSVVADCNHVVFFNPHEPYRASHPGALGDDANILTIHPRVLEDALSVWDASAAHRPSRLFDFEDYATDPHTFLLQRVVFDRLATDPLVDPIAIQEATLRLIGAVIDGAYLSRGCRPAPLPDRTARDHMSRSVDVMSILATRFRERISLAELSKLVDCSPFHLCRIFREQTGLSIHRYLNRLRLRAATDELAVNSENMTRMALSFGFSSHSHFSASFRREFGVSPSRVRRAISGGVAREMHEILDRRPERSEAAARSRNRLATLLRDGHAPTMRIAKPVREDEPALLNQLGQGRLMLDPCPYYVSARPTSSQYVRVHHDVASAARAGGGAVE
ncbi:MAG: helix-turn-helix transcriptional regulator [Phycisphaerales bacterium]|nr:helix-turn-helix transcriptional regulator [Phycisphaerales bacterium]